MAQFEVFVDGASVAKREGSWLSQLGGHGWPEEDDMVASVAAALGTPAS